MVKRCKYGKIYVIKNKVNDKVYVGLTKHSLNYRWNWHMKSCFKNGAERYKLYEAMQFHGVEQFYIELVEDKVPLDMLHEREVEVIKYLNSFYRGYNTSKGGDGKFSHKYCDPDMVYRLYAKGDKVCDIAEFYGIGLDEVLMIIDWKSEKC